MTVPVLPTRLAGCRVIRALGSDARAELFLAQSPDGDPVVVKRFAVGVPRAEVDRELTAVGRTAHPHVVRLLDAEIDRDGRVHAVLGRLPNGSLARWLEARDRVGAGEAVTVLAPLADALRALHAAGVAHGGLTTSRVLFDSSGAPVIIGFGGAAIFEPGTPAALRERIPEAVADLDALRSIAVLVLRRVAGSTTISDVLARVESTPASGLCDLLAGELFEHAAGSPVRFDVAEPVPTGMSGTGARPAPPDGGVTRVAELLDRGVRGMVGDALRRAWERIDPGRRRLVVGVAAAGLAALVAVLLVPGNPTSSRATVRESPSPSVRPSGGPEPTDADRTVAADDPVAAFPVLVRTRERCLRDQDALCLAAVDERGSPAERADGAAIDGSSAAPSLRITPDGARLIQTLGAAALVESGAPPTRTLVVRTRDGWRIRDLPATPEGG